MLVSQSFKTSWNLGGCDDKQKSPIQRQRRLSSVVIIVTVWICFALLPTVVTYFGKIESAKSVHYESSPFLCRQIFA